MDDSTTVEPVEQDREIPLSIRVATALARLRPRVRGRVYLIVADWPEVRALARATIGVRAVLGLASQAVVGGRISSGELTDGLARIRDLTAELEAARKDLARRAGAYDAPATGLPQWGLLPPGPWPVADPTENVA